VKIWVYIVRILERVSRWLDWYFSDERKKKEAEDRMFKEGLEENDEAKLHAALMRRKRRQKK
jgi:hypothetical protein